MSDPTTEFFDTLGDHRHHRHHRLLESRAGSIRFDLAGEHETEHWFVEISHEDGELNVSHDARAADCVVRADRGLFNKIVTGETNMLTAWLRNQVIYEGNSRLAVFFEQLLPGPPGSRHPRHDRGNAAGQHWARPPDQCLP
jgi:putative sterol carrier protein